MSKRVVDTGELRSESTLRFPGLDPSTNAVWERLARVAHTRIPVLILGETGTGKELAAEWVFANSGSGGTMLKLNCASLSESVVESELFGHEKGSFTGAHVTRRGIFEAADGGTLLLDEVGELPLASQAKLLRVLEYGEIIRVGSTTPRKVDVRIVAATHRNLPERIATGLFREDLFFRLNGVSVRIPPLRERASEIVPLARYFVNTLADAACAPRLSTCAERALNDYEWPGNVRELRQVIARALALASPAAAISVEHLELGDERRSQPSAPKTALLSQVPMRAHWQRFEREHIEAALVQTSGNQTHAAALLGISRRTLTNKLNAHRLPRPRKR